MLAIFLLSACCLFQSQSISTLHDDYVIVAVDAESDFEACGVADFDNDGDLDIACGDAWYEAPEWKRHSVSLIRSVGGYRVDFADVPMDVDGDGNMDIVSCSWHDRGIFWRRNPGEDGASWKTFIVDQPGNMETAIAADVDGDGALDFLPNVTNKTVWYRVENGTLQRHTISSDQGGHGIGIGDVDGDGRADVLGPNGWYRAPEDPIKGTWVFQPEWNLGAAGISIVAHDFNGDGRTDIFWGMGHDYGLYWLEQTRDEHGKRAWLRHTVDTSWSQAHGLVLVDLDKDGSMEIVTGKRRHAHNGNDPGGDDELRVCTYAFDKDLGRFTRTFLTQGGQVGAGHYPVVVDLDADGDLDVVLPGKSGLYILKRK